MSTVLDPPRRGTTAPPARGRSSGWRPALRVARRELLRAKGRSLLVLAMVLLPVTGVVALDTLLRTADVSVREGLDRSLGDASAVVESSGGGPVAQDPELRSVSVAGGSLPRPTAADLLAVLPPGAEVLEVREGGPQVALRTQGGRVARAGLVGVDLSDPAARAPFPLLRGRAPAGSGEVVVTPELERSGLPVGARLTLPGGTVRRVTGVVDAAPLYSDTAVLGLPEAVGLGPDDAAAAAAEGLPTRHFVSGPPVLWPDVLELNALGATVLSRAVVLDPPPEDAVPDVDDGGQAATTAAILALIVVMAVLEVVLLAGPAFAVGARRQRRALALLLAGGGEPRHVRRVVLAQGLLVGVAAAVLGVPLGIALAAAGRQAALQWFPEQVGELGPFEVSLRDVTLFALLAAGTAVLAALLPAVVAARQPVVAALHGRRRVPARVPVPTVSGLVLLVLGVTLCLASFRRDFVELWIAFAAVPTVLGAVLLAPALLAGLGRGAGRLPLPLRYAVRDADRQRGRTAPAVAAIAATVAAAVALGTAAASDQAEARRGYQPSGPPGVAVVTAPPDGQDWAAVEREARRALPGEPVTTIRGIVPGDGLPGPTGEYETVVLCRPGEPAAVGCNGFSQSFSLALGAQVLVGVPALDALAPLLDPAGVPTARRAVQAGGVTAAGADAPTVELRRLLVRTSPAGEPTARLVASVTAPVVPLGPAGPTSPALAVVSDEVAAALGGPVAVGLTVGDGLTVDQERALADALSLVDAGLSVYVERGREQEVVPVVLVLGLVAGTLVLAGTLAASSLALTEARPDFATLGAVGAPPRARRTVAGAYAATLAFVGAALGTVAGLVPGGAAAMALTRYSHSSSSAHAPLVVVESTPAVAPWGRLEFVTVPWPLLAGLLVALPLLAGAVAAATTRSRLPGLGRRVVP